MFFTMQVMLQTSFLCVTIPYILPLQRRSMLSCVMPNVCWYEHCWHLFRMKTSLALWKAALKLENVTKCTSKSTWDSVLIPIFNHYSRQSRLLSSFSRLLMIVGCLYCKQYQPRSGFKVLASMIKSCMKCIWIYIKTCVKQSLKNRQILMS